ncbi:hypothetical protein [Ectobacillus sp. sgz5001026]|uniref:hypothetical protein n=1 Tax=Ectobacillus sp. sgz5001026 TaxID=3242473 RepID=UPI0036D27062
MVNQKKIKLRKPKKAAMNEQNVQLTILPRPSWYEMRSVKWFAILLLSIILLFVYITILARNPIYDTERTIHDYLVATKDVNDIKIDSLETAIAVFNHEYKGSREEIQRKIDKIDDTMKNMLTTESYLQPVQECNERELALSEEALQFAYQHTDGNATQEVNENYAVIMREINTLKSQKRQEIINLLVKYNLTYQVLPDGVLSYSNLLL